MKYYKWVGRKKFKAFFYFFSIMIKKRKKMMKEIKLTDIKGVKVGQYENQEAATGCSVVIVENGATAGVDVRGGGPATRETDLLNPINMVQQIHAVMLSGGSAFGLDAASGANILKNMVLVLICL